MESVEKKEYKPIIMVIDDDYRITQFLAIMLQSKGYDPITASNGKEALKILEQSSPLPALILTDYAMPILNGCDFIETISDLPQYKDIPVVLVTGSDIESVDFPHTDNYKELIRKPFDVNTVLEIIKRLIAAVLCPA